MARYYEETALIEFVKQYTPHINGETTMECVERAIREAPTADVVPKSEGENYKQIAEYQQRLSVKRYFKIKRLNEELKKAKTEVAREIFEEIEKILIDSAYIPDCARFVDIDKLAELKKKYTENENG